MLGRAGAMVWSASEPNGRSGAGRSRHLECRRQSAIAAGDGIVVWDAAEDTRGLGWREFAGTMGCPVSGSGDGGAVRPGVGWLAIGPRRH